MRRYRFRLLLIAFSALAAVTSGCSSTMSIERTFTAGDFPNAPYRNILVIALGADYNARARFEREMASVLSTPNTAATAYYEIAGGDQELSREKIIAAVEANEYDGVIVTRLNSVDRAVRVVSGQSTAKVTRRNDRPADFFRYDYEVLNDPSEINMSTRAILVSDFFNAADAKLIWTAESTVSDKENINTVFDDTVRMISARVKRDGLAAE